MKWNDCTSVPGTQTPRTLWWRGSTIRPALPQSSSRRPWSPTSICQAGAYLDHHDHHHDHPPRAGRWSQSKVWSSSGPEFVWRFWPCFGQALREGCPAVSSNNTYMRLASTILDSWILQDCLCRVIWGYWPGEQWRISTHGWHGLDQDLVERFLEGEEVRISTHARRWGIWQQIFTKQLNWRYI